MVDENVSANNPSFCIFDLFLDIPHPNASQLRQPAQIVEPPDLSHHALISEIYGPDSISRIARFAYPDYDDRQPDGSGQNDMNDSSMDGLSEGSALNKEDVYITSFTPHHHTFTLQLQEGSTVYAHVRRYLPAHPSAKTRVDVGRRSPRAMIILTRATGGEQFYASILKTIEALILESGAVPKKLHYDEAPAQSFLHELFNHHWRLCEEHSFMVKSGRRQNVANDSGDVTRSFLEQNINLFKIEITGVEFQSHFINKDDGDVSDNFVAGDYIRFHLPDSLQPGYVPDNIFSHCEDMYSPILPLLRCVGAVHTIRILSALLCERRVIFISKCITKLSKCVRAASAMLNQGLLAWRHILIPVLPPHLMKYLTHRQPYLIGLLEPFSEILDIIPGLVDVISIHLDFNDIRTHNMSDPAHLVPDILKVRRNKNSASNINASEFLAQDLSDILLADRQMWGRNFDGSPLCLKDRNDQKQLDEDSSDGNIPIKKGFRNTILRKVRPKKSKGNSAQDKDIHSLEEIPENPHSADADAFFGKIMRSYNDYQIDLHERDTLSETGHDSNSRILRHQSYLTVEELLIEDATLDPSLICDNIQGEEEIRCSFVIFFLLLFGDLGMLLSESKEGTFWLDRKKFLLRRKLMGDTEDTPMFVMLARLTRTIMFEKFIRSRIFELEKNESKKMMPHHIPLFVLGEKHLRKNRLAFNFQNIRRVILTTAKALPQHNSSDNCESIRSKVIRLSSSQPFLGDRTSALYSLAEECRECNGALIYAMGVIWTRILETRGSLWKQPIWALHVLKILILHGPITAATEAMNNIDKIRALRTFTAKQSDQTRQVRLNAMDLYIMLMHQGHFFMRRRRVAASKIEIPTKVDSFRWADYLIRKLPLSVPLSHIHLLLRPEESTPCIVVKRSSSISSATTDDLTPLSNENENDMDPANESKIKSSVSTVGSLPNDDKSLEDSIGMTNSENNNSNQSIDSEKGNNLKSKQNEDLRASENDHRSSSDLSGNYDSKISRQNDHRRNYYEKTEMDEHSRPQDPVDDSMSDNDDQPEYVSRRHQTRRYPSSRSVASYTSEYSEDQYYPESVSRSNNLHRFDSDEESEVDDLLSHVEGN